MNQFPLLEKYAALKYAPGGRVEKAFISRLFNQKRPADEIVDTVNKLRSNSGKIEEARYNPVVDGFYSGKRKRLSQYEKNQGLTYFKDHKDEMAPRLWVPNHYTGFVKTILTSLQSGRAGYKKRVGIENMSKPEKAPPFWKIQGQASAISFSKEKKHKEEVAKQLIEARKKEKADNIIKKGIAAQKRINKLFDGPVDRFSRMNNRLNSVSGPESNDRFFSTVSFNNKE